MPGAACLAFNLDAHDVFSSGQFLAKAREDASSVVTHRGFGGMLVLLECKRLESGRRVALDDDSRLPPIGVRDEEVAKSRLRENLDTVGETVSAGFNHPDSARGAGETPASLYPRKIKQGRSSWANRFLKRITDGIECANDLEEAHPQAADSDLSSLHEIGYALFAVRYLLTLGSLTVS